MARIAVLAPLPPERTGVADYSAALLRAMSRQAEVVAFSPHSADPIEGVAVVKASRRNLKRLHSFDAVLAQVGNSEAHEWIIEQIRSTPAFITLHDLVLHHLVATITINRGRPQEYVDAMDREAGRAGRLLALGVVDGSIPPLWESVPELYPLTHAGIGHAQGVIAHSAFTAAEVAQRAPGIPVAVIPHLTTVTPRILPGNPARRDHLSVGVFGFITPQKRLPTIMQAVAHARSEGRDIRLVVAGDPAPGIDVLGAAATAGLPESAIRVHGYMNDSDFNELMEDVDVGVALRHPTLGETSGVVTRLMAIGKPVIVSQGGWYDELPGKAVTRIAPGPTEVAELSDALALLADEPELRSTQGAAGQEYTKIALSPGTCADAYLRFMLGRGARKPLRMSLSTAVGSALDDVSTAGARTITGLPHRIAEEVSRAILR